MAKATKVNGPIKSPTSIGKKFGVGGSAGTGTHPVKGTGNKMLNRLPGHSGPSGGKTRRGSGQDDAGNLV